jgi:hypothetical protein
VWSPPLSESAEAASLRAALAKLIEQGKVNKVTSTGGESWFAANHHKNAQLDEIRRASPAPAMTRPTIALSPDTRLVGPCV